MTNILVNITAVNIDVIIPIESVIANPFIGPEPKPYRHAAAIKVVKLASTIVPIALL